MTDAFRVLEPGPYTTVQDGGRYGYLQFGVPPSGALDLFAYRVANMLVGNREEAAVLEITVFGPRLEMLGDADLALTGAPMVMTLNGGPVEGWRSFRVTRGDVLQMRQVASGCRAYLAVTGGVDVPVVMGSRSTYPGGRLGGYGGRPLRKDDIIRRGEGALLGRPREMMEALIPDYPTQLTLRCIPGPQDDFFDEGLTTFLTSEFVVSSKANRMGYRLQGPKVLRRTGAPESIVSEGSLPGSVQVPADGQPIILLVEQTVGGYTKIATVIFSDIPRVAQAKPGDRVRFEKVSLEMAHVLGREQAEHLEQLREHFYRR